MFVIAAVAALLALATTTLAPKLAGNGRPRT
jgi:hypothetical protein